MPCVTISGRHWAVAAYTVILAQVKMMNECMECMEEASYENSAEAK